jgi:hypothetical protein
LYVKLELRAITKSHGRREIRDLLDHAVDKVFLLGIAGHVLERQDRERRLLGERQCRLRRCGRADDRGVANPVDPNRPGDVLEFLLAGVLEAAFEPALDLIVDDARDAHFAGFRQGFEPGRDIHSVAVYVVILGDHIPEIDTDPKVDPLVARNGSVPFGHTSLEFDRAGDGFDHARELDQHAISGRLDDTPFVFGDLRIDELAAMGSEPR